MKISQDMAILFFANTPKKDASGKTPIYCRITLQGKRAQFSTGKKVDTDKWIPKQGYLLNSHENAKTINIELDSIKSDLRKMYHHLSALHNRVTADMLLNEYLGKTKNHKTLIELFSIYNTILKQKLQLPEPSISPYTLKRFEVTKKKIQSFIKNEFHVNDKLLNELKPSFAEEFKLYLLTIEKISMNTAMKYIKNTKQVLRYAQLKEWMQFNPIAGFKCTYKNPVRERLTWQELMDLYHKELPVQRLTEVRDVYVFSCFTGYAYVDVLNLTAENVIQWIDGNKWLIKQRTKTNNKSNVPLLDIPLAIIEKYKNHPYCINSNKLLPVNSNQRYNAYLKEIAVLCRINKNLTTHTARHTFATTILMDNDCPIESASEMLGHTSIRTTQIYTKVTDVKVSKNMIDVKSRINAQLTTTSKAI